MKIGEIMAADREITLNEGKKTVTVTVANKGDRPVQIGSHFHFFEVNKCLSFDREKAYGYHLDIPSGTSVRFEPGEEKEVQLTEMGGRQRVFGLNDLTRAQATDDTKAASMETAKLKGFLYIGGTNNGRFYESTGFRMDRLRFCRTDLGKLCHDFSRGYSPLSRNSKRI